jgi:hypothetical protein
VAVAPSHPATAFLKQQALIRSLQPSARHGRRQAFSLITTQQLTQYTELVREEQQVQELTQQLLWITYN